MDLGWCRQHFSDDRVVNVDGRLKENMQNYMPRLTQRPHVTTRKLYFSHRRAFYVRVKFLTRKQAQHVSSTWKFDCQNCTAKLQTFLHRNVTGPFQNGPRWYCREHEPFHTSQLSQNISDLWQLCLVGGGEGRGRFCNIHSAHDRNRVKYRIYSNKRPTSNQRPPRI